MEYQYQLDTSSGQARATFSLEHEIFGPWFEVEIGHNIEKLTQVLEVIDQVLHGKISEKVIAGSEYSVVIDQDDVFVVPNVSLNGSLNGKEGLPEELAEQGLILDIDSASCSIDDFRNAVLAWSQFVR